MFVTFFLQNEMGKQSARKMLMKLTKDGCDESPQRSHLKDGRSSERETQRICIQTSIS